MQIARDLADVLRQNAKWYPIVTVTGPRQAGKTTLVRAVFADHPYVSLEPLDIRTRVQEDPRGFLAQYANGAIIDEVQQVPELLSYLQEEVDGRGDPGRFILTGSQNLGLSRAVSQSLAGRTAVLHLYPPSLGELRRFPRPPQSLWDAVWAGSYPRIWDVGIPPERWLADYVTTYVERDVRQVLNIADLSVFRQFLQLCAGRTGQEENLADLGSDTGIARLTARAWLSVLEASYILVRLPAWTANVRKRVVRRAKTHFVDTGLACQLLGISGPQQLRVHPLRGALFESWVAAEVLKVRAHRGAPFALSHLRETRGAEVDLIVEAAERVRLVEVKSGATVAGDWMTSLRAVDARDGWGTRNPELRLIYGGSSSHTRQGVDVIGWSDLPSLDW
jgi:predicted AAA+ superfamily ATPase